MHAHILSHASIGKSSIRLANTGSLAMTQMLRAVLLYVACLTPFSALPLKRDHMGMVPIQDYQPLQNQSESLLQVATTESSRKFISEESMRLCFAKSIPILAFCKVTFGVDLSIVADMDDKSTKLTIVLAGELTFAFDGGFFTVAVFGKVAAGFTVSFPEPLSLISATVGALKCLIEKIVDLVAPEAPYFPLTGCNYKTIEWIEWISNGPSLLQNVTVSDPAECQILCFHTKNCVHFTFYHLESLCTLTDKKALGVVESKQEHAFTSGPKYCGFCPHRDTVKANPGKWACKGKDCPCLVHPCVGDVCKVKAQKDKSQIVDTFVSSIRLYHDYHKCVTPKEKYVCPSDEDQARLDNGDIAANDVELCDTSTGGSICADDCEHIRWKQTTFEVGKCAFNNLQQTFEITQSQLLVEGTEVKEETQSRPGMRVTRPRPLSATHTHTQAGS